jgi:hypothetical protein
MIDFLGLQAMDYLLAAGTFTIGVVGTILVHIVGSHLHHLYITKKEKSKIDIEGHWSQEIPAHKDHRRSEVNVYYDKNRRIYACDGTNFANTGDKFCVWKTVSSSVDHNNRKFFYIYEVSLTAKSDTRHYGFGVINLRLRNGVLEPEDGHFTAASVDGKAIHFILLRK